MRIKEADVFWFIEELRHINWCHANLILLDEVSFDIRGMIRKRGYSLKGQTVAICGDFQRKSRVSVLAFMGVTVILHTQRGGMYISISVLIRCGSLTVHRVTAPYFLAAICFTSLKSKIKVRIQLAANVIHIQVV
ncbi:hypothetical protein PHMEG_00031125 [Phytophthora megakarya]|uniref:Uncharacterized protein n=1 Tax=Phytophthora megakarya TaxID=4795 RepID=A0A225UZ19_9STRA|nr:hypothetical protein PHMEG_00031125 [Phytophthora megakarya]